MTPQEREIIGQFIARVGGNAPQIAGSVPSTQAPLPPIDPDADRYIGEQFASHPEARYRITQLAFVQEAALTEAQNRIKRLEYDLQTAQQQAQAAPPPGQSRGLFGGLFGGGGQSAPPRPAYQQQYAPPPPQPVYAQGGYQPGMFGSGGGSGFLGSALTTAAGVAGGVLAADAISSMFSPHGYGMGGGFGGGGFGGMGAGWGGGGGEVINETTVNNYGDAGSGGGADPWSGGGTSDPGSWDQGAADPGPADSGGDWGGGGDSGGDAGWTIPAAAAIAASDHQAPVITEPGGAFQAPSPKLVLASGSVTRRALLDSTGLIFTAFSPDVDESAVKIATRRDGGTPDQTATALAALKAAAYKGPDALVIGCDQILVCENIWFDKPPTLEAARQHLLHLRGRPHTLVTATVCTRNGQRVWSHLAKPRLTMRNFTAAFLDAYIAAEDEALLDSVGAYRVEGFGMQLFDAMEGEHSAILGLPLTPLLAYLRAQGIVLV